jgi:hypothetical protein
MTVRPTSPEAALDTPLSELAGTWLELRCPRHQGVVLYPVDLLRRRHGDRRLGTLLSRFRCQRCGGPPEPVYLCETPQRVPGHAAPPGWSVELRALPR